MLRQLRFACTGEGERNLAPNHAIRHNPCVRVRIAITYARHRCRYPRQNRGLGTPDRILRIHGQNVAALVSCGSEAKSASMEKWHHDYRLWSEHRILNPNRGTGCARAYHWWIPVLFPSLDIRLSRWILDCTMRSNSCSDRKGQP